jgi:hypothetical protein
MNEDLKAYLDNELSPARRAEIEAALQQDPLLRAELEQLRSITESLRGYIPLPQPTGYENLAARLKKAPVARPWWTKPLPLATSLLAVVAIGAVGTRQLLEQRETPLYAEVQVPASAADSDARFRKESSVPQENASTFSGAGGSPVRSVSEPKLKQSGQALLLVVNDVPEAEKAVEKLAAGLKGSISPTSDRESDHVSLRIVVPQDKVEEARSSLAQLGSLKQSSQAEMESSLDEGMDSLEALKARYYELREKGETPKPELKRFEQRVVKLEEERKGLAEGRLVEIRLTINARSKGVP